MSDDSKLTRGIVAVYIVISLITIGIFISDRQYAKGYNAGYVDGQEDDDYAIERTTNKNYDGGYMDGYETGYDDGFDSGVESGKHRLGLDVGRTLHEIAPLFDIITPDTEEESSALQELEDAVVEAYSLCGWKWELN